MISVQKFIFPGIALGCIFLVFVASLISNPTIALASSSAPAAVNSVNSTTAQNAKGQVSKSVKTPKTNPTPAKPTQTAKSSPSVAGQSNSENGCSLNQQYPDSIRQWCGLIVQYAGKHNLDPNLVAAVMLQESGGDPQAYSKNGAVGLLQVMPRDGLAAGFMCINGPCFSSRPSTNQLYDPEFNISYGTEMLAGLIQKYGDIREALRSYGPMNMGYQYADIILNIMNRYH